MRFFDIKAVSGRAVSLFVPVVLLGCSAMPLGSGNALAQTAESEQDGSTTPTDPQLMYELMIAELAGSRGQMDVFLAGYLSASKRTDDPRVSERAFTLAVYFRQWEEAESVSRRWIDLDPDNPVVPRLLAQSLLHQDKADEAAALFITELRADELRADDDGQLLMFIQTELQQNGNPDTSVAVMQQIVDAFENNPQAHVALARAHITNSDTESALSAVQSALRVAPQNTDALLLQAQILNNQGESDESLDALSEALKSNPDNNELRLGYVQLLVAGGRFEEVPAELETIHSTAGANPNILFTISQLAVEAGFTDKAVEYLNELKTSELAADKARASFYLARIRDDEKAYDAAIAYYDEVQGGDLYFNSRVRAAELTALTGDIEQSRERLQQLAASMPDALLLPRIVSAESRILQNADQHEEAVKVLSEGLQRFPDESDLLYARALAAQNSGDNQMMMDDLKRLIELEPENAHALNALGYYYADENIELEQAQELLVKANDLLPGDPAIMDSLGWLRFRQENFADAVALLQAAYDIYPDPEIAAHLGAALWFNGEQEAARKLIDSALKDEPEDQRLLDVRDNTFQ